MNKLFFILISLFTATVWANIDNPFIFFAKIDGSLVPLSGDLFSGISVMSYNKFPVAPAEFTLQDNYTVTQDGPTPGFAGIFGNLLAFSPYVKKLSLSTDVKEEVLKGDFFSCEKFPNSDVHWITRKPLTIPGVTCFKVDIHFSTAVPQVPEEQNDQEVGYLVRKTDCPFVFFADVNGTMIPLSSSSDRLYETENRVLSYKNSYSVPIEFQMQDDHVVTQTGHIEEYPRYFFGLFIISPYKQRHGLNLDARSRVQDHSFFSCRLFGCYIIVTDKIKHKFSSCFKIDVYLLPYDRKTRSPVKGSYIPT